MKDIKIRDTEEVIWTVLTSFGYDEEEDFCERDRYFLLDTKEATIADTKDDMARAQAVAACVEAAFACGLEQFEVKVKSKNICEILIMFGFESILSSLSDGENDFVLSAGSTVFASGVFGENRTLARIDVKRLSSLRQNEEALPQSVSKTLVFAEEGAIGIAYDVCYTLRVNGCIVELYCKNGDIKSASEYADKNGISAVIRCFADGTIEIKELAENEIVKTTVSEFLGYYEDDDEDCDCGHTHEHGGDCDCGHHHN